MTFLTFLLHPISDGRCTCGSPACDRAGKHPAERWGQIPLEREPLAPTADRGIGIATGARSGVFVVDLDVKNGIDGIDELKKLGEVPATYTVATPTGGFHLYFKHPGFVVRNSGPKSNPIAPGVDIRGDGGYVVAPGSPHKNGRRYTIAADLPIATAPAWLLAWPGLKHRDAEVAAPASDVEERFGSVPRDWRVAKAKTWLESQPPAIEGEGGDGHTWKVLTRAVHDFCLTDADMIADAFAEWNSRCEPPWSGKEWAHKVTGVLTRSTKAWNTAIGMQHAAETRIGLGVTPALDHDAPALPVITIDTDLDHVVREGAAALGRVPNLYQRGGELVRIVRVADTEADAFNIVGTPTIRGVPFATLKTMLSSAARWLKKKELKNEWKLIAATPSDDVVTAISQLGEWPRVRPLTGIVETPTMRPDGSILQVPGYDSATAYIFEPGGVHYPAVPEQPTQDDARRALAELADVFADFPFASDAARATSIAAVLTVVGRPSIEGNVPAFGIDAPTRGTGKTLLADTVGMIATGRRLSKITFPASAEELEKILAAYARQGAALFSWDNVTVPFGGGPLDKVLTCGDTVDLRILGRTEVPTFRWRAVQLFTGNGIELAGDTSRRVLMCRLESPLEDPENRADFRHTDLLGYVTDSRAQLVVAALTVLRAYVVAGKPGGVKPWGSFEHWSRLVASAVAWSGGADPQGARPADDATADPDKAALAALLVAWPPSANERTAGELLTFTDGGLHHVINSIVPLDERGDRAMKLGRRLGKWRGRNVGGRRLAASKDTHSKQLRWRTEGA